MQKHCDINLSAASASTHVYHVTYSYFPAGCWVGAGGWVLIPIYKGRVLRAGRTVLFYEHYNIIYIVLLYRHRGRVLHDERYIAWFAQMYKYMFYGTQVTVTRIFECVWHTQRYLCVAQQKSACY